MYFTTPEGHNAFLVFATAASIFFVWFVYFFVWRQLVFMKQHKHEQRQRQKKLARQNNLGRRIYNALDRLVNDLNLSQALYVVKVEDLDGRFIVEVNERKGGGMFVIYIIINLFGDQGEFGNPILVLKKGQPFNEKWPLDDDSVLKLIQRLKQFLESSFGEKPYVPPM